MNEELGLAAELGQRTQPMRDIDQIVAMLMQGVSPEELIQAGVPRELVLEAIDMVTRQATNIPPEQSGLAGMMVGGM